MGTLLDAEMRCKRRGALAPLALLTAGGAFFWTDRLWNYFPRNAPLDDALVIVVYAASYGLLTGLLAWLAWRLLARVVPPLRRLDAPLGHLLTRPGGGPNLFAGALVLLPVLAVAYLGHVRYRLASPPDTGPLRMPLSWGPSPYRIQLIGIDGADLRHIEKLIEDGELPNFQRFLRSGACGPMETISPHSPVVWTSIATGQDPKANGIGQYRTSYLAGTGVAIPQNPKDILGRALDGLGFRVEGAVSSNERRVRAVWEILTQFGIPSLVVNWWASYPAETIHGEVVSNHMVPWSGFQRAVMASHGETGGLTSPAALTPELLELLNETVAEHGLEDIERNAFTVAGYQYYKARDSLVFEIYQRRMQASPHDFAFATVYMQGVDTASHAFTTQNFGKNINEVRPARIEPAETRALWDELVRGAYRTMDERIGLLLDTKGENDVLILVSDHGWDYDGTSHWNKPAGIFMAVGGPFVEGRSITAHVYDVLPTLAQLLGLPLSQDLRGQVLVDALDPAWVAAHPVNQVPTYGPRGTVIAVDPSATDGAHIDRLRDLGYVE